ncbi:hypothetical protein [Nonomuraea rubra]|uniref:Uncharacterized protein n=1 Tax=Nonomuraea rubra TaxID=46180 RepID=A0A7X0NPB3_9ACTN|nr:hypothetical protein [Nonomuraea rubra]MBB6547149.1 hypothetical protein [Nonomuraea rubra]
MISGGEAALWGLLGSACIELLEIVAAIRRTSGWPWQQEGEAPASALVASVVIRVGVGAAVAAALGTAGQLSGVLGAFAAGIGAPLFVEQLSRQARRSSQALTETEAGRGSGSAT